MLTFVELSLCFFLFLVIYSVWYYLRWPRNLPPGPIGLPILGCVPYVQPDTAHLQLTEWTKQYGPLLSFFMGSRLVVVLGNTKVVREALVKQGDVFSGRHPPFVPDFLRFSKTKGQTGIIGTDGPIWKEQRRFALSTLRDFGLGRPLQENSIMEELDIITEMISDTRGRPFDPQMLLNNAVSNIICQLTFGKRFSYDDEKFRALIDNLNYFVSRGANNILAASNYFPIMVLFSNFFKVRDSFRQIFKFSKSIMEEHKARFDSSSEPADYIDAFLKAQTEGQGHYFTDQQLHSTVINLFAAGTETTATTLRWGLLYMGLYPEVQEKVVSEITAQLGKDNTPKWADRAKLPYVEAVIMETQRLSNLTPMALIHRSTEDTELLGYAIPKDSVVIPLLWAVQRDPEMFEDPDSFRPERFLEADMKTLKKYEGFMPFSAGKRICLGESLAKMELFVFFTSLLTRFRFHFTGLRKPKLDEYFAGVTISPKAFQIIATPRSD